MASTCHDDVLLKSGFGCVDGGTCSLCGPYEGLIWDRLRSGGLPSVTAEIALTATHLSVNRFIGKSYRIPVDQIIGVYTGSAIGGRYWGRGSVLKVVWQDGGQYRCSWLMLGRGRDVANAWAKRITPLLRPEFVSQQLAALVQDENHYDRPRQNRRTALWVFGVIVLSLVALAVVAWIYRHR
jgi:hypothetical protein